MGLLTRPRDRARVTPGPGAPTRDAGMVTAEAAVAMVSLVLCTALLLQVLMVFVTRLRVGDAARTAVRAVARGEPESAAAAAARRTLPGAVVSSRRDGDDVVVTVALAVRPPLLGGRTVSLRADARAAAESSEAMPP